LFCVILVSTPTKNKDVSKISNTNYFFLNGFHTGKKKEDGSPRGTWTNPFFFCGDGEWLRSYWLVVFFFFFQFTNGAKVVSIPRQILT
jgi:hypothetical protein